MYNFICLHTKMSKQPRANFSRKVASPEMSYYLSLKPNAWHHVDNDDYLSGYFMMAFKHDV